MRAENRAHEAVLPIDSKERHEGAPQNEGGHNAFIFVDIAFAEKTGSFGIADGLGRGATDRRELHMVTSLYHIPVLGREEDACSPM